MFSKTYTLIIYYISVPSPGTERTTYRQPFDSAYGAKAMTSAGRSQKCIGTKIPVFIRSMNCWAPRIKSVPKRGIYRKHDNIHRLRIFRYYIQFFQVIPFRLRNFLWSRLIFPMPIIQVSGMKNQFTLRLDQKRDTDIGRSERPNR